MADIIENNRTKTEVDPTIASPDLGGKQAVTQNTPDQDNQKSLNELRDLIRSQYSEQDSQAPRILERFDEQFRRIDHENNDEKTKAFLADGKAVLTYHAQAKEYHTNTTSKKAGILQHENGGNKASATDILRSASQGSSFPRGSFREKINADKKDSRPIVHTHGVDSEFRKHVFQAEKETHQDLQLSNRMLNSYLLDESQLTKEESQERAGLINIAKAPDDKRHTSVESSKGSDLTRNTSAAAAALFTNLVGSLGKGIISTSVAEDSKDRARIIQDRNAKLARKVALLDPNSNNFSASLRECENLMGQGGGDIFSSGDGQVDALTKGKISDLENQYRTARNKEKEAGLKQLDQKTQAWEQGVDKGNKDNVAKSDQMWKWRMLSLLLLVTPFAPIAILGPLAGFLGPIVGSGGLTNGLLAVMDKMGPVGDLFRLMKVDVILKGILNLPGIDGVVGVYDAAVTNPLVQQGLGPVVGTLINSPTTAVALGAGVALYRLPDELEHSKKRKDLIKTSSKDYDDLLDAFVKDSKAQDVKGMKNFVGELFNMIQENSKFANFVRFLQDGNISSASKDKIYGNSQVKVDGKPVDLKDAVSGKSFEELVNLISSNAAAVGGVQDKFLAYSALQRRSNAASPGFNVDQAFDKALNDKDLFSRLKQESTQFLNKESAKNLAQEAGLNHENLSTEALKSKWTSHQENRIKNIQERSGINSLPTPPSSSPIVKSGNTVLSSQKAAPSLPGPSSRGL